MKSFEISNYSKWYLGVSQVFTQGSGDIVLDTCTELWNGEEICKLEDADR